MSFNKKWLEIVKPIDVSALTVGEWYREHESGFWYANDWWFYKSRKQVLHMAVALVAYTGEVEYRNFRWDAVREKWVSTQTPIATNRLEFYKKYWYPCRLYKNFTKTDCYKRLVETVDANDYMTEMCKRVYYRIEEYSLSFLKICDKDKNLITFFAKDLLRDFGVGEALTSLWYLAVDSFGEQKKVNETYLKQMITAGSSHLKNNYSDLVNNKINLNIYKYAEPEAELIAMLLPEAVKLCLDESNMFQR